jgi:hypothetical protein
MLEMHEPSGTGMKPMSYSDQCGPGIATAEVGSYRRYGDLIAPSH